MFLHSRHVPPPNLFLAHKERPQHRFALIILSLSVKNLLMDLLFMVQDGVRADSALKRAENPTQYSEDWEQERERLMTSWAKSSTPWSFQGTHYKTLVKALTGHLASQRHLPGLSTSIQMTGAKVAQTILAQIDEGGQVKPSTPLTKQGTFKFVLPSLLQQLCKLVPRHGDKDVFEALKDWFPTLFEHVLVTLNVEFLPWKSPDSGNRRSYAVYDSYINCRGISTDHSRPIPQSLTPTVDEAPSDPLSGSWHIHHNNIVTLSQYFFHSRLPSDIQYPASDLAIWVTLRQWVNEYHYSPDDFRQHLALIIAIFMNRLSPHVLFPGQRSFKLEPQQSLFQAMRAVPWGSGRKVANRGPGGATFGTWYLWILACISPNSPLHARLNGPEATLGQDIMDVLSTSYSPISFICYMTFGWIQIIEASPQLPC
jgi:hypothetical protein